MLKGWKTIIFNALMLIGGLTGAQVDPELVQRFAEEFVAVLAAGNGILRLITDSPVFRGRAGTAGRGLKGLAIAALCVLVVGCTERIDSLTGMTLDERCADYRLGLAGLDAIRDRDLTAAEANRRIVAEVFIGAKCSSPGPE